MMLTYRSAVPSDIAACRHLGWTSTGTLDANDDEVLELLLGNKRDSAASIL